MTDALYPRFARVTVDEALRDTPVIVLQGARQVGKSTLAEQIGHDCDATVLSLDDSTTLRSAHADPVGFVAQAPNRLLVIDEAQRAPELILPLKANVDRDRRPGRFLLTGSADLLQVKGVGDSLAGRAETVEMLPLSQGELARRDEPEDFIAWLRQGAQSHPFTVLDPDSVVRGGFPPARERTIARARGWFTSYVARLADHDARELQQGGYADRMRALLRLIAAQGQSELVKAKVARVLDVAESTVDAYLRLAVTMRLAIEVPAWSRSPRGRVVGRPKVCLTDTGLSAALCDFSVATNASVGGSEYFGTLLEQFVVLELLKQRAWSLHPYDLYHYRERDGLEVDVLVETLGGDLIAIEVKSTQTITAKLWANLERFRDRYPDRRVTGVLLYTGDIAATLHGWLHILPVTALWQH